MTHSVEAITEERATEFLREKGYTVVPKERVRIYNSCTEVSEYALQAMDEQFLGYLRSRTASEIAHAIVNDFEELTYHVEYRADPYDVDPRRRYSTEVAFIVPKR